MTNRKPMKCSICDSPFHRANKCPDRVEKVTTMNEIPKGSTLSDAIQSHRLWHETSKTSRERCITCNLLNQSRWCDGTKHLGLDSIEDLPAGASATIVRYPQMPFKGERLAIPQSIAGCFQIEDIRVGQNSQSPTADAIPAEIFGSPRIPDKYQFETLEVVDGDGIARGERFDLQVCQSGQILAIGITNISKARCRFRASIIGVVPR